MADFTHLLNRGFSLARKVLTGEQQLGRLVQRFRAQRAAEATVSARLIDAENGVLLGIWGEPLKGFLTAARDVRLSIHFRLHWTCEWIEAARRIAEEVAALQRLHPRLACAFHGNTPSEVENLLAVGLRAVWCNHNAFLSEQLFQLREPPPEKSWDAFYDAQIAPYKRHDLAARIGSLAVLGFRTPFHHDDAYCIKIRRELAHAVWLNDPSQPDYRFFSAEEVADFIRRSRVGLCLSEVEGAMYASAQYLLCGIPVVTVPSQGGRDCFFHPDYVETVEPTPDAVATGVQRMIARAPAPAEIRSRTLALMAEHRHRLLEFLEPELSPTARKTLARDLLHSPPNKLTGRFQNTQLAAELRRAQQQS